MRSLRSFLSLTFVIACAATDDSRAAPDSTNHRRDTTVRLDSTLGSYSREITTTSDRAKAFFNQGLRLEYAFNHEKALKSYEQALREDSTCAMCWWGIALASGPNINAPMTREGNEQALRAISNAGRLDSSAAPLERELIAALQTRYDETRDRAKLDSAYAVAMARVARAHPSDPDVQTLYGAALMNLSPWNYWDGPFGRRAARAGTPKTLEALERAVALAPTNPGACHYYIHLVEAGQPDKALPCAERLASLMPGAGHLVHMPAHIYIRVGRYRDAVELNKHAVHADESGIRDQSGSGLYAGAYYPHNYHFLAFAATMAGLESTALEASRTVAPRVPFTVARDVPWIQNAVVMPQLTLVTFGRWDAALREPLPSAELADAHVLARYARGVAYAALGDTTRARETLAGIDADLAKLPSKDPAARPIVHIARHALAGEIALRAGRAPDAVREFRKAADVEDALLYDEPPLWYYPIRHSLGRALLDAGRPADAEVAYREDLDRFPENGWSLFGLAQSLRAQKKANDAAAVSRRFDAAWAGTDVVLTASRF